MLTTHQMAKRMQFSVVGLPHYTIWHMYEPSVDDIRRIEEMESEKKQREDEERLRRERTEKIQVQFDDGTNQWEKDKETLREMTKQEQAKEKNNKKDESADEV